MRLFHAGRGTIVFIYLIAMICLSRGFQCVSHRRWMYVHMMQSWVVTPSALFSSADGSPDYSLELTIETMDEMEEVGALLSVLSRPPDVLLLDGDLGAGKTTFARGFVQCKLGLESGVEQNDSMRVTSPTYLLSNTYVYQETERGDSSGQPPRQEIHHMDLYRLTGESATDFDPLQFGHVFKNCISLIEWPGRLLPHGELMPPPTNQLNINISILPSTDTRTMALSVPQGSTWKTRLEQLVDEGMIDDLLLD